MAAVDDGRAAGGLVDEEVEVVADELHLGQRVIDGHRVGRVLLGAHDLAELNLLDLILVRIGLRSGLRGLLDQGSGGLAHGHGGAVAGAADLAAGLDLAQGALHLAQGGLEGGVEAVLLRLGAGEVALARGGDLDAVGTIRAAGVRLVLQLDVEERQGRIEALNLGELALDTLGEVLRDLHVAPGDGHLGIGAEDLVVVSRCRHLLPTSRYCHRPSVSGITHGVHGDATN